MLLPKYRVLALNAALAFALAGSVWGSRTANISAGTPKDFLRGGSFRDWKAVPLSLTDRERELLKPDAVLLRSYVSPDGNAMAELAVIAGHRKQTVHTPGFCLAGGGWETLSTADYVLTIGSKRIPAIRSIMGSKGQEMHVVYFFTDGEFCTRSLVQYQAAQMIKRMRAESPVGALVRVIVPVQGKREAAEQISSEFARAMLPSLLEDIRKARRKS